MKYQWRTDLNWLCGLSLSQWLTLARRHGVAPAYAHRALQLSLLSGYNSAVRRLAPEPQVAEVKRPLFVLGHWRSGTTFLYHLLAADPRHVAPNAWQVTNPDTFQWTSRWAPKLFANLIPEKRVQDDVPMGFHLPEEDEYAIGLLSGCTPYLGRSFPSAEAHYERFLTLKDCSEAERGAFRDALRTFAGRVAASAPGRRVVLKSPPHTARVDTLLEAFPDARFLHIHRHPYEVFRSTRHLYDTVDWFWTLQRRGEGSDAAILRQYTALHRAWFEARERLPADRWLELPYRQLADDPHGALSHAYEHLDLGPYAPAQPAVSALLADRIRHRNNPFPPLDSFTRKRVQRAAEQSFTHWEYQP